MTIDVILPCLNEAGALPGLFDAMPTGFRPLVVDNGSTDGSPDIARAYGVEVVHAERRGYGAACHAGLLLATSEVICVMDADGSLDPHQLLAVSAPVLGAAADLVLGRRVRTSRDAWPWQARLANHALAAVVRRRTGLALHDIGPMRAARRSALLDLGLTDRRFGYPVETVLAASAAGWRIDEVPVDYFPRTGRSKVTGSFLGYLRTVRDMRSVLAR